MFCESMLSMPAHENVEREPETSYGPAKVALSCAWLVALIRGILAFSRHEGLTLDVALMAVVLTSIPLIALHIWRTEHRRAAQLRSTAQSRPRPRLVLVSHREVASLPGRPCWQSRPS